MNFFAIFSCSFLINYLFIYFGMAHFPSGSSSIYVSHLGEYLATDYRLSIGKLATKYGQSVAVKYRGALSTDMASIYRSIYTLSTYTLDRHVDQYSRTIAKVSTECRVSVDTPSKLRRQSTDLSVPVDASIDMSTKCCGVNVRVYFRLLFQNTVVISFR